MCRNDIAHLLVILACEDRQLPIMVATLGGLKKKSLRKLAAKMRCKITDEASIKGLWELFSNAPSTDICTHTQRGTMKRKFRMSLFFPENIHSSCIKSYPAFSNLPILPK